MIACIGTKELVASLPRMLSLRDPSRDTVLYPAVAYPTYEMGAMLAGLRAVPVPVDDEWHLDLDRVDPADAERALVLWLNDPSNPTGAVATPQRDASTRSAGRGSGASSSPATSATPSSPTTTPVRPPRRSPRSHAGADGVLAVHSLSKRSNMAGLRAGFVAGDRELVGYLGEMRKHGGLMMPAPVQAAAAAALGDDEHVREQQARYARRRAVALPALESRGLVHDGGPSTFYLWLRDADRRERRLGHRRRPRRPPACVVAPGDFYGTASADHVRLALTLTDDAARRSCATGATA